MAEMYDDDGDLPGVLPGVVRVAYWVTGLAFVGLETWWAVIAYKGGRLPFFDMESEGGGLSLRFLHLLVGGAVMFASTMIVVSVVMVLVLAPFIRRDGTWRWSQGAN